MSELNKYNGWIKKKTRKHRTFTFVGKPLGLKKKVCVYNFAGLTTRDRLFSENLPRGSKV